VAPWKSRIEAGVTPGELVNSNRFFPEMFANLYNTGEQSGQLDDTLRRLQNFYEEEGFRKLRLFTRIMNGVIYGAVALLIAFNVIKFYVGYFNGLVNGI
jgi:type IV pilus assembly protein PilC